MSNAMWQDPHSNGAAVAVFDRQDNIIGLRGRGGEIIKTQRQFKRDQIGAHFHMLPYDWRNVASFSNNVTAMPWNEPSAAQVALCEKMGHVRMFWPRLTQLFKANTTDLNMKRLIEFSAAVEFWTERGVKVHWVMSLEKIDPANTGTDANCVKIAAMIKTLATAAPDVMRALASVEPINEVYQIATTDGWAAEFEQRAAKVQRVAYVMVKQVAPACVVLSHSFQGGEGATLAAYALTSAQTPDIEGMGTGAGTVAAHYIEALSWHPYGYTNHQKGVMGGAWLDWIAYAQAQVQGAIEQLTTAPGSPWEGRAASEIEVWATECNATMQHQALKPSDFRYEILSSTEKRELLRQGVAALVDAGFKRVILYAADDYMTVGHQYIANVEASPEGEFLLTVGGYLPGDTLEIGGGAAPGLEGVWVTNRISANKITLEGSTYAAGWTAETTVIRTLRHVLGGWARELSELVAA